MIHLDPDFQNLSERQRYVALRCLCRLTQHATDQRRSGLTQIQLVHAIGTALLGIDLDIAKAAAHNQSLATLNEEFKEVDEPIRHRLLQLFTLTEIILEPLPKQATETLKQVAKALSVNDTFVDISREYSQGAYGIAASDLARKGYLGNPDLVRQGGKLMHVHKVLTDPFELDEDDPELLEQWLSLEYCPQGSLGRNIWEYYQGRGFIFTGQKGSVNPSIAQHDWIHLLCDYNTTIEGELEVFSFIGSAIPDVKGFSFLIAIVSLFETGRLESWGGGVLNADKGHLDLPGMPERVADAIRRGRTCNQDVMYGIDYFQYSNYPINEVRRLLNIIPKDPEIESPGVWHPDGITLYQREHGDYRYQPKTEPLIDSQNILNKS